MSEGKSCNKCQSIKFCWQLGKKAHEKDDKYTIKEFYCETCFDELDKTKCWKDYSSYFFYEESGGGQEKINFCSDQHNEEERIDKENKDYCQCLLRCDRHRRNYVGSNSECKACQRIECQKGYHPWNDGEIIKGKSVIKCKVCGSSKDKENERERETNCQTEIWNSAIRANC